MAYFVTALVFFIAGATVYALFSKQLLADAEKEIAELKASATKEINKL